MELYRLRCFQVVVEEGGFKRATARLHITQPALSYQIKQLEGELGVQLLYRRPGGVRPTEAGGVLFQQMQHIDATVRQARRAIQELADGAAGEVRIGTVNSVGIYFLPEVLWAMRERAPTVRPTVLYRESDSIVDALLSNRIDFGILADPRPQKRLDHEFLLEEPVELVSGRAHPLFECATVKPAQLMGVQFVTLSPRTPTGSLIQDYLDRLGIVVDSVVTTDNVETVKRMVAVGMGVAFLPRMVVERDLVSPQNPEGRLGRSRMHPTLNRRIHLVTWKESPASRAVEAFIAAVRERARTWHMAPAAVAAAQRV